MKKPIKVNAGDPWGRGEKWFMFYCPNEKCKRQLSGGDSECQYCKEKIDWSIPNRIFHP